MPYLFVFLDGKSKVVRDNLTTANVLGVQQGMLRIFRVRKNSFDMLVFDENKVMWIKVQDAKIASCTDARFHL